MQLFIIIIISSHEDDGWYVYSVALIDPLLTHLYRTTLPRILTSRLSYENVYYFCS